VTLVLYRRRALTRRGTETEGWGARSIKPSEGSRWRLRRTRAYPWYFNRFSPGNPCQKRDLEKRQFSMRIDLSTVPRVRDRLILTQGLPFFKAQAFDFRSRISEAACFEHAAASAAPAASLCAGHAQ
jgi:hypothetical protein